MLRAPLKSRLIWKADKRENTLEGFVTAQFLVYVTTLCTRFTSVRFVTNFDTTRDSSRKAT
jgi:hypothetical protein